VLFRSDMRAHLFRNHEEDLLENDGLRLSA